MNEKFLNTWSLFFIQVFYFQLVFSFSNDLMKKDSIWMRVVCVSQVELTFFYVVVKENQLNYMTIVSEKFSCKFSNFSLVFPLFYVFNFFLSSFSSFLDENLIQLHLFFSTNWFKNYKVLKGFHAISQFTWKIGIFRKI
jgi:hypothetical protein